ncbi:MAG: cytochrome c [Ignavibacteriaceae bacterium]
MIRNKIDEILEQVKSNPGAAFGLLYPYVLVVVLAIGLYYLGNIGNVAQQKVPPLVSEVPEVTDLTVQQPRSIPPVDVNVISEPTPELIEKGRALFQSTCAACHGEDGRGTGPGSIGLNPAPRNFNKNEGWINGESISGMYTTLEEGIPNSGMIAYDFLLPEEKFALIHYIRSTFIQNPPIDTKAELAALDQIYNLSSGVEVPGQIPTEFAEQLIKNENNDKFQKAKSAYDYVLYNDGNYSSMLLDNITSNLQLAFFALANTDVWRKNKNSLIIFLTNNVNQNGFNGRIFNLNENEWASLYNFLNNIL